VILNNVLLYLNTHYTVGGGGGGVSRRVGGGKYGRETKY
jgi:hypothetical protein